jgi:hypothetical protein
MTREELSGVCERRGIHMQRSRGGKGRALSKAAMVAAILDEELGGMEAVLPEV